MARNSSRSRMKNEINAGSMADIAFLLLIFFLVTTTIDVDRGITVKLPPWSEEEPDITKLKKRNVFSINVNAFNQLQVRGELMDVKDLKEATKEFISNPQKLDNMAEDPTKALISLKNDRGTKYNAYIEVYNEITAAYNELWDELSMEKFGVPYSDDLEVAKRREIRNEIPKVLSEAEPTAFGEE